MIAGSYIATLPDHNLVPCAGAKTLQLELTDSPA